MIEQIETRYGTMFIPDTDTGQYWWLKNIGASPEDAYIEEVCGLLRCLPPGIAVDVGANFGCWTLPLADCAIAVDAFEPQPGVFKLLVDTIAANDLHHVNPHHFALGDKYDMVTVPDLDLDFGTNFGGAEVGGAWEGPMASVPMITLDGALCGGKRPISFIKIDVEGSEQRVLAGARQVIARWRPVLFVEALHPRTDTNALAKQIIDMGYAIEARLDNFLGVPL